MKKIISFLLMSIIIKGSLASQISIQSNQENFFDSITGLNNIQVTVDSLAFNFIFENVSKDTLYLFSSYIDNRRNNFEELRRISKSDNTLITSFLPLTPFLFPRKSDNLIINPSIIDKHQIVYEFKILLPKSKISFSITKEKLVPNLPNNKKMYCNLNEQKIEKERQFFKIKKRCKYDLNVIYNYQVKFAIYGEILGLNDAAIYYLDRESFSRISLNYKVITCNLPHLGE